MLFILGNPIMLLQVSTCKLGFWKAIPTMACDAHAAHDVHDAPLLPTWVSAQVPTSRLSTGSPNKNVTPILTYVCVAGAGHGLTP